MNPPPIEFNPADLLNGFIEGFNMMWQVVGPDGLAIAFLIVIFIFGTLKISNIVREV